MKWCIFLCILSILGSCKKASVKELYSETVVFPDTVHLKSTMLNDSCMFAMVESMEVWDTLLIFKDIRQGDYFFQLYNTNGKWLKDFARKGRGPGELVYPGEIYLDRGRGCLQVLNSSRKEVVEYFLEAVVKNEKEYYKTYPIYTDNHPRECIKYDGDRFLCLEMEEECRFALWEGEKLKSVYSDYPEIEDSGNPVLARALLSYVQKMSFSPDFQKFVCGTYIGAVLETFSIEKEKVVAKGINRIFYPRTADYGEDRVRKGGFDLFWDETTRIGFERLVATGEGVYTLLNGIMGSELMKRDVAQPYPKDISVFDWECRPKRLLRTDHMLLNFCVDEAKRTIYGLTWNQGENSIIKLEY